MANIKISALPSVQPSGYTNDDLLVIVNYDVSSGTTKNTPLSGLTSYILSGVTFQADYLPLSGGTVTGDTTFNQGLTANTISASAYLGLPLDVYVTGGTYSAGTITFTNNSGNTFDVSGLTFTANTPSTCITDLYVDNLYGCSPITIHDSLQSTGSTASGILSIAYGYNNQSTGDYSHSEGFLTTSSGESSHSEGRITSSFGDYSHSEGENTISYGESSHSEGYETKSISLYSHVEGTTNKSGAKVFSSYNITSGLISFNSATDLTSEFTSGFVILYTPTPFPKFGGVFSVSGSPYFDGGTFTFYIQLNDTSINTSFLTYFVDYDNLNSSFAPTITGLYSHSEGGENISFGGVSHSEGRRTISFGDYSHSEGYESKSFGDYSHSEGNNTSSLGDYSHSEGESTTSSGSYSHSEGSLTTSSGNYSHSEGDFTTSSGNYSHSEGRNTISEGNYSHSEGYNTKSLGDYSHTEGYGTIAFGESSHSEGYETTTALKGFQVSGSTPGGVFRLSPSYGNVTSAFTINKLLLISTDGSYVNARPQLIKNLTFSGGQTIITTYRVVNYNDPVISCENNLNDQNANILFGGLRAHSEGVSTKSLGLGTHSEGQYTIATNINSHSEGLYTNAHSNSSHAEGYGTTAGGSGRWVNINYGELAHHSEGYETQSIGDYSHSEGASTFSIGPGSHSEGNGTYSVGDGSHSEGLNTNSGVLAFPVFSANNNTILIDTNVDLSSEIYPFGGLFVKTVSSPPTFISKWMKVTITGTTFYSGTSKFEIRTSSTSLPSISYVFHEEVKAPYNGERTSSDYSHSEGFKTTTIGSYSHSEGSNTIAGEEFSHAEGLFTLSNGAGSHSEGISTDAVGDYSHAEGDGTTSIGIGSHSEGYQTTSLGNYSHSEGIGTIALADYQHVSGKYNLTATTEGAFILGNGTDDSNRSNLLFAGDNEVNVSGKTITTNFQMTSGATSAGYVLTDSDGSGNAQWQPASGITGVGNVFKYTTTSAFTASVTQTITHNLNTKFVHCSVWDSSSGQLVTAQVVRTSGNQTNAVDITISTSGDYDILITG